MEQKLTREQYDAMTEDEKIVEVIKTLEDKCDSDASRYCVAETTVRMQRVNTVVVQAYEAGEGERVIKLSTIFIYYRFRACFLGVREKTPYISDAIDEVLFEAAEECLDHVECEQLCDFCKYETKERFHEAMQKRFATHWQQRKLDATLSEDANVLQRIENQRSQYTPFRFYLDRLADKLTTPCDCKLCLRCIIGRDGTFESYTRQSEANFLKGAIDASRN